MLRGGVTVLGAHGYYLRPRPRTKSRHRLAGPRSSHPDVRFPACSRCQLPCSPVLRLDFDDPLLAPLGLWSGEALLLVCHSGCRTAEASYAWDHADVRAPRVLTPAGDLVEAFGPDDGEDREYESIPLVLERRGSPRPGITDVATRVGGEPAWLERCFEEVEGTVREVLPEPPSCPRCAGPTRMLAQWSEAGLDEVPARVGVARAEIMGNPFIRFWFGCARCRVIVTLEQLD